jgi:hypothetical protein
VDVPGHTLNVATFVSWLTGPSTESAEQSAKRPAMADHGMTYKLVGYTFGRFSEPFDGEGIGGRQSRGSGRHAATVAMARVLRITRLSR